MKVSVLLFLSQVLINFMLHVIILFMLSLTFFSLGDFLQSRDSPPSTAHNMCEMEDIHFQSVPESVVPVKRSRVETTNSQSHPSEDVLVPATQSQPVLLEDPLVLNSPSVFIPKKYQAVFKRNKLPQCEKFPSVSRNSLKKKLIFTVKKKNLS